MSSPVIHLRSVVAVVDRFPVLAGVDLDVAAGEVVLLEGSNGAGKTSLLRLLAGILPVTSGEALVFGHNLAEDRKTIRRSIGLLGHEPFLYDDLTIAENIEFFVQASAGDLARVAPAIERFGLSGRVSSTPAGRASQGQRRRVALAILDARNPLLWLLDEPHAGLDAGTRRELDAIIDSAAASGRTVLYSSHEAERAAATRHRPVRIEGGQVQEAIHVA